MLEKLETEQAILNNALNKMYDILICDEFSTYLTESDLKEIPVDTKKGKRKVYKDYPTVPQANEVYVNTSSYEDCMDCDLKEGITSVAVVVDFYIADTDLHYLWKYLDATREWIKQFYANGLIRIIGRAYSKAEGATANHFTLNIIIDGDVLTDGTNPVLAG